MFIIDEFLSLSPITQIICAVFVFSFIIQAYYYLRYYTGIWSLSSKINKGNHPYCKKKPPVSVIICAKNEADNLEKFLPSVLEQDYPEFEVIVVNDGSTDESSDLLEKLQKRYPNLYHTFLPMDAKYMSRKKMCLTVGIKAARFEHLLLIDADCQPASKYWIANMVQNFNDKTDIVLGYGAHAFKNGFVNSMICYDIMFIAMQYMGFAIKGKPYMGVGRNLAYKKSLFFKNKGFASHLNLVSGDDDLFIQEVANRHNTSVEFSERSISLSNREMSFRDFRLQKERHLSTSSKYTSASKTRIGCEVLTRGLFYTTFIALLILFLSFQHFIFAGITAGLFLLRFIIQAIVINKTCKYLQEKMYILSIPLFDIFLPLLTLYIISFGKIGVKEDSMWR